MPGRVAPGARHEAAHHAGGIGHVGVSRQVGQHLLGAHAHARQAVVGAHEQHGRAEGVVGPTGVAPDEYLAAAAASGGGPPDVPGGPPHFAHGMVAELTVT